MRGDDHNIYRAVLQIISKYTNLKIARQLALLLGEQYQNKKQQTNKQTETTTKSKNTKKKQKKRKPVLKLVSGKIIKTFVASNNNLRAGLGNIFKPFFESIDDFSFFFRFTNKQFGLKGKITFSQYGCNNRN